MKTKRVIWTIVFLSVTLAAIVMEVVAGIFHPAGTIPWTEYLARYVPWPFQLAAYVILAVWLPFHFWRHDHLRKIEYNRGRIDGFKAGKTAAGVAAAEMLHAQARSNAVLELRPGLAKAAQWVADLIDTATEDPVRFKTGRSNGR